MSLQLGTMSPKPIVVIEMKTNHTEFLKPRRKLKDQFIPTPATKRKTKEKRETTRSMFTSETWETMSSTVDLRRKVGERGWRYFWRRENHHRMLRETSSAVLRGVEGMEAEKAEGEGGLGQSLVSWVLYDTSD